MDATEVPLRLSVKLAEAPVWLTDFVGQTVTLFWHGVSPELTSKKNGFRFKVDPTRLMQESQWPSVRSDRVIRCSQSARC